MKIRIDDNHRRTASPRADQLLFRFLLAVVATRLHRLPRVRTGAQRSHQRGPSAAEHNLTAWATAWEEPRGARSEPTKLSERLEN